MLHVINTANELFKRTIRLSVLYNQGRMRR